MEYQVSEKMRRIWDIEMDIYEKFRNICDKYGLKHYVICGTLLGAVRHKGFIPWDDDMDVAMPYDDYKRFLEIAPQECQYPYFIQSHLTDPEWAEAAAARLRRSDTTACTKWEHDNVFLLNTERSYNFGIFLDIFPMCNVPDEPLIEVQKAQIMGAWKAMRGKMAFRAMEKGIKEINPDYVKFVDVYKKYADQYTIGELKDLYLSLCNMNDNSTERVGLTSFKTFAPRLIWKREWFAESVEMPFENITVVAPSKFEEILTATYGDWRTPVKDAAFHGTYVIDPDVPYTEKMFGLDHLV